MSRKRTIEVTSSAVTLSKNQSGSLVMLNRAAGITVTLPNAGRGLEYEFVVNAAVTGTTYKVIGNDSASMRGSILTGSAASATLFIGDNTHVAVDMNGSTSGGLLGTRLKFVCDEDGIWHVNGEAQTGTPGGDVATPFATS